MLLTDIDRIINKSLDLLYSKDKKLFTNDLCERCLAFRFGLYFYQIMQEENCSNFDYDIDMEYNRHKADIKYTQKLKNGTYPDLIVHKRNTDKKNLLVIEFKKWKDNYTIKRLIKNDITKIEEFVDCNGKYKYKYGASIIFAKKREDVIITWVFGKKHVTEGILNTRLTNITN